MREGDTHWSDEEFAFMRACVVDEGKTASQTAVAMTARFMREFSRNAILSKVHRNGVAMARKSGVGGGPRAPMRQLSPPTHSAPMKAIPPRLTGKATAMLNPRAAPVAQRHAPRIRAKHVGECPEATPPHSTAAPLDQRQGALAAHDDLRQEHCRWPIGDPVEDDFHFCAAFVEEPMASPYCPHHKWRGDNA